ARLMIPCRPLRSTTRAASTRPTTSGRSGAVERNSTRSTASGRMARSLSDLPDAAAQHRRARAVGGEAIDRDLVPADHEVDVDHAGVDAFAVRVVAHRERERLSERDVAGGVLVEQRVVEDGV